jgi:uncharacterized coiled-coil protein SlyX
MKKTYKKSKSKITNEDKKMKKLPEKNATNMLLKTLMGCPPLRSGFVFTATAVAGLALVSLAQAVNPPPDGDYPGFNTAEGQNALLSLDTSTGLGNTAVGSLSLQTNVDASFNTGVGVGTLSLNTGDKNTAVGAAALLLNTRGGGNTALGVDALLNNTTGEANTANGVETLIDNVEGSFNTATGFAALSLNVDGCCNTANGNNALFITTGTGNTAVGFFALSSVKTGSFNVAVGDSAGDHLNGGDSNNIDIGFGVEGVAGESNTVRIGNNDIVDTFIRGISGTTIASGAAVLVASNGHLGTVTSSQRFKENVKPMDQASEALFALKPVTFRYRREIDPVGTLQFGLVAEDVEKINRDLVVRDEKGQVNSVRYDQVNAMLLNEFLKQHTKVLELEAIVARQQKSFARQQAQIETLGSRLQKVSAQIEIRKTASQLVLNNP